MMPVVLEKMSPLQQQVSAGNGLDLGSGGRRTDVIGTALVRSRRLKPAALSTMPFYSVRTDKRIERSPLDRVTKFQLLLLVHEATIRV